VYIRTSSRLIRSPKVDWWPGSVKTSGGLHIRPPGLGHRVADRLRFAKTVAGMDRMLGDSGQRARARRPRAARSAATRRRQRLWGGCWRSCAARRSTPPPHDQRARW